MKIDEIAELLDATIHSRPDGSDIDINCGGASDLMSDVLTYMSDLPPNVPKRMILITGLMNPQVIRTSALVDIPAVLFTRGKVPGQQVIDKAKENDIAILSTDLKTYTVCGILYSKGLQSINDECK
ncbi:MAG: hypothetical protein KAS16_07585 [Thermoplasmata archaeon]|nr:hypothetical protein [Thermoplasmata archaeon]